MSSRKKHFIAGAVCPNCSEMDSLVLYRDNQSIECVSCDYQQSSEQRDVENKPEIQAENKDLKLPSKTKFKDVSLINITNLDD